MAQRSAARGDGRRPEPLVIILVGVEGFERSCELLDGDVLSPYEVAQVLPHGDHKIPYAAGGPTSTHNGQLHCGHHNRLRNTRPDDEPP